jgi:hypothetical protein
MHAPTTIQVASLTITLDHWADTWASVRINGRTYAGDVICPAAYWSDKEARYENADCWIDDSLLTGLYQLPEVHFEEVIQAIGSAMMTTPIKEYPMTEHKYDALLIAISATLEGLCNCEELTYELLQRDMWALVRAHMYVYASLLGSDEEDASALAYFMENDRQIPADDIDNDAEWDDLASTHDAYLGALYRVRAILRLSR